MVRVGGLQQKVQAGIAYGSGADHMPVKEQLERIEQTVRRMTAETYRCLRENVLPALEREGIVLRGLKDLTDADKRQLRYVFQREIFPVLTPLAIDPGHPFPHLLNKSLNLAVMLRRPGDDGTARSPSSRRRPCWPDSSSCRSSRAGRSSTCSRPWRRSSACICRTSSPAWSWASTPPSASRGTATSKSTTTRWKTCSRRSRRRCASAAAAPPCACRSRTTLRSRSSSS